MTSELRKLFSLMAAATATAAALSACGGGNDPTASAPAAAASSTPAPAAFMPAPAASTPAPAASMPATAASTPAPAASTPAPAASTPAPAASAPAPAASAPTTNVTFGPVVDYAKITSFCPSPGLTNAEVRLHCDRSNEGATEVIGAVNTFLRNLNATGVVSESNFPMAANTPCTISGISPTGKFLGSVNGVELSDLSVETAFGNPRSIDTQQSMSSYSYSSTEHRISRIGVSKYYPAANSSPIAQLEFPESANNDFRAILYWNNDRGMSFRCRINR